MEKITTIGLDLAKSVFQVHAIAADGEVLVRRPLRRLQVLAFFARLAPCVVGLEACGSAHAWARALAALGHSVKMMPPQRSAKR
jgi:transposase